MNTKEFMEATGINNPSIITRMIKKNVVQPVKEGKSYVFTQMDVDSLMSYRENPHRVKPPTLVYDLSQVPSSQMVDELRVRGVLKPK